MTDGKRAEYLQQLGLVASKQRTICEVLRELWDLSLGLVNETVQAEVQARLVGAYEMAKRMDRKLHQYKFNWDSDFWQANTNWREDLQRRQARKMEST